MRHTLPRGLCSVVLWESRTLVPARDARLLDRPAPLDRDGVAAGLAEIVLDVELDHDSEIVVVMAAHLLAPNPPGLVNLAMRETRLAADAEEAADLERSHPNTPIRRLRFRCWLAGSASRPRGLVER